jgi:hypothetical protein
MTVSRVQGGRASGAVRSQAEPGNEERRLLACWLDHMIVDLLDNCGQIENP